MASLYRMIRLERVSKEYDLPPGLPGRLIAADQLSLSLPAGEVFGLVGPNGAGKSTTLKMICGLLLPTFGCGDGKPSRRSPGAGAGPEPNRLPFGLLFCLRRSEGVGIRGLFRARLQADCGLPHYRATAVFAVWPALLRGANVTDDEGTCPARGVSMQFGRFHGIALLTLGVLLLIVQAVVSFEDRSASAAKAAAMQQRAETDGRPAEGRFGELAFLPGIIGIVLAGAGWYALLQVRRRGVPDAALEDPSSGPGAHVSTPTIWKER